MVRYGTSEIAGYRRFLARIMSGWLFLILLILWGLKALPHHIPDAPATTYNHPEVIWAHSLVWMATTTLLLIFLIIPGWFSALLVAVFMAIFVQAYRNWEISMINPVFVMVFIPFMLPARWFPEYWKGLKYLLLLVMALHSWLLPLSWKAIPGYTLYTIPFIPWKALYDTCMSRLEPR